MHGDRSPHDIPRLSDPDHGGGYLDTGRPNELWSYGEEVYEILKKYLEIRLGMKDYIKFVMNEASRNGSPVMYQGMTERSVYLPDGKWRNIHDGMIYDGRLLPKLRWILFLYTRNAEYKGKKK